MSRFPDRARSRAVLIGIAQYGHLPDIPAVRASLRAFHAALTDPTYGTLPARHCYAVPDPTTALDIGEPVASAASEATDLLLVYYAGHGEVDDDGRLYLTTANTDTAKLRWTALPYSTLREELAASPAAAKILILDCCFSGRAIESMAPRTGSLVAGQIDIGGTYIITSTEANKVSYAPKGATFTAFTDALLKTSVPVTPLTVDEIYETIHRELAEQNFPRPQRRVVDNTGKLSLFKGALVDSGRERHAEERRDDWKHWILTRAANWIQWLFRGAFHKWILLLSLLVTIGLVLAIGWATIGSGGAGADTTTINIGNGKFCLADPDNKGIVQISSCSDHSELQWVSQSDGALTLDGKCMSENHPDNGAPVVLESCNGSPKQAWTYRSDGTLLNHLSSRCLDLTDFRFTSGTPVQIYGCDEAANQQWHANLPVQKAEAAPLSVTTGARVVNGRDSCLDLQDDNTADATAVRVSDCTPNSDEQKWSFEPDGTIRASGHCLSVNGGGTADDTPVVIYSCDAGRPSQQWSYRNGQLLELYSGKCLDIEDYPSEDTKITTCSSKLENQIWKLT